jgi:hypothetical protein
METIMGTNKSVARSPRIATAADGVADPWADTLNECADALDNLPSDPYGADIVSSLRTAIGAVHKCRALAFRANDALISRFTGSYSVVEAARKTAADQVDTSTPGLSGASYQAARDSASNAVWRNAKQATANDVLAEFDKEATEAGAALAAAIADSQEVLSFASLRWTGPYSLRPGVTADMQAWCNNLEGEIDRSGLKVASDLFSAMVGRKSDAEMTCMAEACLRCIQKVRATPGPVLAARHPEAQRSEFAAAERTAADTLYDQVDQWMAAHRPKSIDVGRDVLVRVIAVASELCSTGNIGALSIAQFDAAYLNPGSAKIGASAINKFQVANGWLAMWMPPKGSEPRGWTTIAGKTAGDVPYRTGPSAVA